MFIAIEGGDGSGKATHTKLLSKYLQNELKKNVKTLSFPRYSNESSYYVQQYLNGKYGTIDQIHADLGALPYAIDRFAASGDIRDHLKNDNAVVVTDRYVSSNLAHQGAKLADISERELFYSRTMTTEYKVLNIPKPYINIVLLMPAHLSQCNVDKKETRSYTKHKRDIHEADASHLEKAKRNYEELCKLFPSEYIAISCTNRSGNMRDIDDIQKDIRSIIVSRLDPPT